MPRRKGPRAQSDATKAWKSRWRYLLRNPEFRNCINDLLSTYNLIVKSLRAERTAPCQSEGSGAEGEAPLETIRPKPGGLRERLGLAPLSDAARRRAELQSKARHLEDTLTGLTAPLNLVVPIWELRRGLWGEPPPNLTNATVVKYEQLVGAVGPARLAAEPERRLVAERRVIDHVSPVSVIEDRDGETHLTPVELGDPHTLYLAVDLAYPQDVLMAFIGSALRETINGRSQLIKRAPSKRERVDKADFELAVYDLATEGYTFGKIAHKVNRPVSSVKSAFSAAQRKLSGTAPRPRKRDLLLAGFDPATHSGDCDVCNSGEDMCASARAYVDQDQVGRRDLPVGRDPLHLSEPLEEE